MHLTLCAALPRRGDSGRDAGKTGSNRKSGWLYVRHLYTRSAADKVAAVPPMCHIKYVPLQVQAVSKKTWTRYWAILFGPIMQLYPSENIVDTPAKSIG